MNGVGRTLGSHLHCNDVLGVTTPPSDFSVICLNYRSTARELVRRERSFPSGYPTYILLTGVLYTGLSCSVSSNITHCLEQINQLPLSLRLWSTNPDRSMLFSHPISRLNTCFHIVLDGSPTPTIHKHTASLVLRMNVPPEGTYTYLNPGKVCS